MTQSTSIRLGFTARDKVSGFTGIVHSKVEFLTGNVQFSLQPPAKDGVLPELVGFDAHQLEEVPGATVPSIEPPAKTNVQIGEKVKDIVAGVKGIAVRRTTFLNGCVYYSVQDLQPNKDGTIVEHFLEWKRLQRVGDGVLKQIASKVESAVAAKRGPGGPNTRGMPQRG